MLLTLPKLSRLSGGKLWLIYQQSVTKKNVLQHWHQITGGSTLRRRPFCHFGLPGSLLFQKVFPAIQSKPFCDLSAVKKFTFDDLWLKRCLHERFCLTKYCCPVRFEKIAPLHWFGALCKLFESIDINLSIQVPLYVLKPKICKHFCCRHFPPFLAKRLVYFLLSAAVLLSAEIKIPLVSIFKYFIHLGDYRHI